MLKLLPLFSAIYSFWNPCLMVYATHTGTTNIKGEENSQVSPKLCLSRKLVLIQQPQVRSPFNSISFYIIRGLFIAPAWQPRISFLTCHVSCFSFNRQLIVVNANNLLVEDELICDNDYTWGKYLP